MDGLLPINHIDELFPRHRGRAPTIHIDELFPSTQMDELPLYTLTSPSLQLRWTGSSLLFILMISSLNSDVRAPTIHINELFPQLRWMSSYNSHRRALRSKQTDELLPINHIDELFPRHRGRAPTIHIDELFPSTQMDELPLYTLTSPLLQLRWTGSFLLFVLTSSSPQLRWTSSHNSY